MRRLCAIRCCRASRSTIPCPSRRTGRRKSGKEAAGSKAIGEANRGLGAVGDRVGAQAAKSKIRRGVEQAPVLGAKGEILLQGIIDTKPVKKGSLALGLSTADVIGLIAAGSEQDH